MIDIKSLVPQLQKQVELLTEDLIAQSRNVASVESFLRENHKKLLEAERFSQSYEEWSGDYLEQVAVSWVLACVFVRFLEDNHLIDECWIAGDEDRGKLADGSYEIFFRSHPHETDREYLKFVFREVGKIPATKELFDEEKVTLWAVDPSGDATRRLLLFFKEIDPERGGLKRQFDTREVRTSPLVDVYENLAPQAQFLGDLYQDLSEHARKKYALLQTPEFVQQFILDRTLNDAIREFGLKSLRLIDPACGSGHFLLGAFDRLFSMWMASDEVRGNPVVAAQNAFDSLFGVDINPFAIAITRFRMLVAAVRACGISRLHQQSYAWKLNLAVGDSLIHGSRPTFGGGRESILTQREFEFDPAQHLRIEDVAEANRILDQGYHVVVGNPPYIIVRDRVQNALYRQIYSTCHQKYSLGVPFTQRFWDLAIRKGERVNPNAAVVSPTAGYIGMITANSFMKREFGKKLIEDFFPKVDLTHLIDTSGAYIPGHGTPTVILFGRARKPVGETVRAVLGIKGEPSTPAAPSQGFVWQSILNHIDKADAQDEFTSSADVPRTTFNVHPWSIGGGGAAELQDQIADSTDDQFGDFVSSVGFASFPGLDDAFVMDRSSLNRKRIAPELIKTFITGECIRDWQIAEVECALAPYDGSYSLVRLQESEPWARHLWTVRTSLMNVVSFGGKTRQDLGASWWAWYRWIPEKYRTKNSITFASVATHNHFALDTGGEVFNRHAPVAKLKAEFTKDDHLALLGLLNSSTACFWMKQTFHNKGSTVDQHGARQRTDPFEDFYEFTGTGLQRFPIPQQRPLTLARLLDRLGEDYRVSLPNAIVQRGIPTQAGLEEGQATAARLRGRMVALQEELDWNCYRIYGLLGDDHCYTGDDLPELKLGERPFEIVMARQIARGELETTWFERHGSSPIIEIPAHWPDAYRTLVDQRIRVIETNREVGLIERPEYKRRWNDEPWQDQQQRALKNWLLDRLESSRYWPTVDLQTTARLADGASGDVEFLQVAALYRGRSDFDVAALVAELIEAESVPFLPVLRYKPSGLRKREVWERTWELQRKTDDYQRQRKEADELIARAHARLMQILKPLQEKVIELERPLNEQRETFGRKWLSQKSKFVGESPEQTARRLFAELPPHMTPHLEQLEASALAYNKEKRVFEQARQELYANDDEYQSGVRWRNSIPDDPVIPVPPKYATADFLKSDYWRLRGKLDVPKERWISYPHLQTESDPSLVVGWAGWDHLLQATALVAYYDARRRDGWEGQRLAPVLAGLDQLLPWIHQWHPEIDPEFGDTAGQSYQALLENDAHELGLTPDDIRNWQPPQATTRRRARKG